MHETVCIEAKLQETSDLLTVAAQHAGLCRNALKAMAEGVAIVARPPTMEELQMHYANAVVAACNGNKTEAAKLLGIGRRSLYRWLARKVG